MSDVIPGTLVHMRTVRRFAHYMAGELIAVPFDAARDLHAKRLAEPLQLFVPAGPPAVADAAPDGEPPPTLPLRQPGGVVRK